TSSIPPGSSVTLTANGGPSGNNMWTATAGTHTVQAFVDDVNRIAESNENNNTLSSTLTIANGAPQQVGSWSAVFAWPLIGLHCIMTPDGKILTYGTDPNGVQSGLHILDIWDPATNTHTIIDNTTHTDEFCSVGLIVPETGQVMISGGDARPD